MNCPTCGTPMEGADNDCRCTQCDVPVPEETGDGVTVVGETVGANCPLCREPLVSALIEDETVCYCGRCRGLLAPINTFGSIVTRRRARQGHKENRSSPFDPAELNRDLTCPNCQQHMDTHPYFGGGNAVVDTCAGCGLIWLDAQELAIIGCYVPRAHQIERTLTLPGGGYLG